MKLICSKKTLLLMCPPAPYLLLNVCVQQTRRLFLLGYRVIMLRISLAMSHFSSSNCQQPTKKWLFYCNNCLSLDFVYFFRLFYFSHLLIAVTTTSYLTTTTACPVRSELSVPAYFLLHSQLRNILRNNKSELGKPFPLVRWILCNNQTKAMAAANYRIPFYLYNSLETIFMNNGISTYVRIFRTDNVSTAESLVCRKAMQ